MALVIACMMVAGITLLGLAFIVGQAFFLALGMVLVAGVLSAGLQRLSAAEDVPSRFRHP